MRSNNIFRRGQGARQWSLKPQDLAVGLKLLAGRARAWESYKDFGDEMYLSDFAAHESVKRLEASGLLRVHERNPQIVSSAFSEFLLNGAKYMFPAVHGDASTGVKTSYAAAPLNREILPGSDPMPVWPLDNGPDQGVALLPLYKKLPLAAMKDSAFGELCAAFDALRSGRARERALASKFLTSALEG